jgi:hypothetical protein
MAQIYGRPSSRTETAVAEQTDPIWWVISGESLHAMLQRCADGEDPDLVMAEEYANSSHERPEGDGR